MLAGTSYHGFTRFAIFTIQVITPRVPTSRGTTAGYVQARFASVNGGNLYLYPVTIRHNFIASVARPAAFDSVGVTLASRS